MERGENNKDHFRFSLILRIIFRDGRFCIENERIKGVEGAIDIQKKNITGKGGEIRTLIFSYDKEDRND